MDKQEADIIKDSMPDGSKPLLQLNLRQILKARIPQKKRRWLPPFLITWAEKLIHQKELNEILKATYPSEGSEFSCRVLQHLDISLKIEGMENILPGKRYMFAGNHPLGGLDGIALISILGKKYGDENIRFLVNDMLMNVEPLREVFLPINKFGRQGRDNTQKINERMSGDGQIFQFPAGLCSRLLDNGEIADLDWQKSFVAKAIEYQRDIVPVYFHGRNSNKFYKIARWRKKLGIKFNLEQILLPSELCKARGSRYKVIFGSPISWQSLENSGKNVRDLASDIRAKVYSLHSSVEKS